MEPYGKESRYLTTSEHITIKKKTRRRNRKKGMFSDIMRNMQKTVVAILK
jgi:hypothetical protein